MNKLTPIQLAILRSACDHSEGFVTRPSGLNASAAVKVAAKLIDHGLVREVRAKSGMPIWRKDENEKPLSLKLLKAGRELAQEQLHDDSVHSRSGRGTQDRSAGSKSQPAGKALAKPRSKRALVIGLLERPEGASIEALMAATEWLPHTTRAALSGLRKSGMIITRSREPGEPASVYRIEAFSLAAA